MNRHLISSQELESIQDEESLVILDCRFILSDPSTSFVDYQKSHIKNAQFVDVDTDLTGKIIPGITGRHPLPDLDDFCDTCGEWGIDQSTRVICYDDAGGALAAARCWWLLRYVGHENVQVLDGGWRNFAGSKSSLVPIIKPKVFTPTIVHSMLKDRSAVESAIDNTSYCIVDSRSKDRYDGQNETIDPIAGHIPTAINLPFADNLDDDMKFISVSELQSRFEKFFEKNIIFYCGSGITAAHNVLACYIAGIKDVSLYAGSWSHWINKKNCRIES